MVRKWIKKGIGLLLAAAMTASLPSYALAAGEKEASWAVYIYLCGSNLESQYGAGTNDLLEILSAQTPENVKIAVFTGGAQAWDPGEIGAEYNAAVGYEAYIKPDAEHNQLFVIDGGKMTLLKTYDEYMYMNEVDTAKTFLRDAMAAVPGERVMVEFWDHGAAFLGAEQDEYSNDIMSVSGLREVMEEAVEQNGGRKIDLLGFDACLMSSLEVGSALAPYADYMVASEESEPGSGWDYSFLEVFSQAEPVDPARLGRAVVEDYASESNANGAWEDSTNITLALSDLSRFDELQEAFDEFMTTAVQAMGDDVGVYTRLARIGETTQASSAGPYSCMVDLYDFMFQAREIAPLAAAADRVIRLLGTPAGTDRPGYTDHVAPEDYLGATIGSSPAVLYRGTSLNYNNSIGLSFFYPTAGSGMAPARIAAKAAQLGMSEDYCRYLEAAAALPEEVTFFAGTLETSQSEDGYVLDIAPAEELEALSRVDYVTVYFEANEDKEMETYLLGSELLTDGWEEGHFVQKPYEYWYSMGGELITVRTVSYSDDRERGGAESYTYAIPAMATDANGEELMVQLNVFQNLIDEVPEDDPYWFLYGKMLVSSVTPIATVELDSSTLESLDPAERTLYPWDLVNIYPAVELLDDTGKLIGYYVGDEAVEMERPVEGAQLCALPVEKVEIVSNETTSYRGRFQVTDLYQNTYISDPFDYVIFNRFDDCKIGMIPPQAYTGEPVEPKVRVLYQGGQPFAEGSEYEVSFDNNVEKGTASVTVTSLIPELPGTLTASFTICDREEQAEECLKLLPEHDILSGCAEAEAYEYMEHFYALAAVRRLYESGCPLSEAGLARLKDQYDKLAQLGGATLSDGGVEVIGALGASAYSIGLTLGVQEKTPVLGKARAALGKVKGERVSCYEVSLTGRNPLDLDSAPRETPLFTGNSVMLKFPAPDWDDWRLFRLTSGSDVPEEMPYTVVERDGQRYFLVETDALGWFVLSDQPSGQDGEASELPFADVAGDAEYYAAVKNVYEAGLMCGGGGDRFDPEGAATRAMAAQVLYRLSCADSAGGSAQWTDLSGGEWFAEAAAWAGDSGVLDGVDGAFAPGETVTARQFGEMLYRYRLSAGETAPEPEYEALPDGEALTRAGMAAALDAALRQDTVRE